MIKLHEFIRRFGLLPYFIFVVLKSLFINMINFILMKIFVCRQLRFFKLKSISKNSDTVFILGSGYSVNDLTDKNWNEIRENYSIGFNFWIANKFIPDIFFFEPAEDYRGLLLMLEESQSRYKNIPIIIKGTTSLKFCAIKSAIKYTKRAGHKLFFARETDLPSMSNKDLIRSLRIIKKLGLLSTNILTQSRSSIFMYIYISIIQGYKNIVLVGVDLSGPYFYDDPNFSLYPVYSGQKSTDLAINSSSNNLIDTETAILALQEELSNYYDFKLFVTSEKSKLSSSLEIYKFHE